MPEEKEEDKKVKRLEVKKRGKEKGTRIRALMEQEKEISDESNR